jgi:hypothetical protein
VLTRTIHATLHEDVHLSKKSSRWVPKLLNQEIKKERVRICEAIMLLLRCHSMAMLDRIFIMDESAVSFHIPQTKQQSKQWLVKGEPGSIKAKVHVSRTKQMVLAFFDSKGLIYMNFMPRGTTVNTNYIVESLGKFLEGIQAEEAGDGGWGLVVPLGQCACSHRRHSEGLDGGQAV